MAALSGRVPCKLSRCETTKFRSSALALRSGCGRRSAVVSISNKEGKAGPLHASASDGASTPAGSSVAGLLTTPDQQITALSALAALHAAAAAAATLLPHWTMANLLGLAPTPATSMQLVIAPGAYLWLIVACLWCLKDAALHDRLGSDTYKRLGLGVMYQSIVFAVLVVRQHALFPTSVAGCAVAFFAVTALVVGRVYAASAGSFSLPTIAKSFLSNLRDLLSPKTISSAFYALCAALAMYQFFWQFPTPGTPLFLADEGLAAEMLKQARGGGMLLAGVVWYTLKDAADRGRLGASTFKLLHIGMAVVAALQVAGYFQIHIACVPCVPKLWNMLIGTGLVTILVCDYQFFFAKKKK